MNVQQLQHRPDEPGVQAVRPGLSALWGAHHPANAAGVTWQNGVFAATHGSTGGVGSAWPQRGADTGDGQGCNSHRTDWPGREYGIRAPYPHETALSWSEIHAAVKAQCQP